MFDIEDLLTVRQVVYL